MRKFFNVGLEFDHKLVREVIENTIRSNGKGYVCIVDANVLTIAQKNPNYLKVLNEATVNSCDGSSIAMLAGFAHKEKFQAWNGPDIFTYYIEKKYSQLLLGSTEEISIEIKNRLKKNGIDNSHVSSLPLPFLSVEDFDYIEIARIINNINPQIIWVSLGAPKQELFMSKIKPHLTSGLMFGIGAAFNFYIGKIPLPKAKIGALKFIWINRIFSEPKKQLSRILPYLFLIPRLYLGEIRKKTKI